MLLAAQQRERRHEHDQRQLDVEQQQDHDRADQRQRAGEERHDPVGDELVERLHVVGQPRDQHAGLAAAEEADRLALQVREDPQPQVLQRALADPADEIRLQVRRAPVEERRADERGHDQVQRVEVAGRDAVVDRELREVGGSEAGRRGQHQRHERQDHAPAVGAQQLRHAAQAPRGARGRSNRRSGAGTSLMSAPPARAARLLLVGLAAVEAAERGAQPRHALVDDLRVQRARVEQLLVRALRGDAPVLHHDHAVGERDRRQAVGDHERRAALHHLAQRALDLALGGGVDARGRVVEDQHARVGDDRARDRDALALAARQRQAALADERVVAVGQALDERVDLRALRGGHDLLEASRPGARRRCCRAPSPRTGSRRRARARSSGAAPTGSSSRTSTPSTRTAPSVTSYRRADRRDQRRLARAGRPDDRDRLARRDVERHVRERGPLVAVGERHVVEADAPAAGRAAAAGAPARSMRGARSSSSNTRLPDATARCAMPSAMPSIRIGNISISR